MVIFSLESKVALVTHILTDMKLATLVFTICMVAPTMSAQTLGTIKVENPYDFIRQSEIVETENRFGKNFHIVDVKGKQIPHQITYDGRLIFPVSVAANEITEYRIIKGYSEPVDTMCRGNFYPERSDDIAWENDLMGFRIYGPETQRKGERSFGYDLFFKYPGHPVLPELYAAQCSPDNWKRVDELTKINPTKAKRFEESFTYHIDHGKGMDCFAVGPTLGAGVAAIADNDTIYYPWCYETADILDNGPLRFTVHLRFAPVVIDADSIIEERVITLDYGSYLNLCTVSYSGLSDKKILVAGFPRRDESEAVLLTDECVIAYKAPTQGDGNGSALLGIYMPDMLKAYERFGHILGSSEISGESLTYYWGAVWDRNGIYNLSQWLTCLSKFKQAKDNPMIVKTYQNK